jgi:hypothetical protein
MSTEAIRTGAVTLACSAPVSSPTVQASMRTPVIMI